MLHPYMIRSVRSPGAVNSDATFSSTTMTVPPSASALRHAASDSTGRARSCRHSSRNTASGDRRPLHGVPRQALFGAELPFQKPRQSPFGAESRLPRSTIQDQN